MNYPTYDITPKTLWFREDAIGCQNFITEAQLAVADSRPDSTGGYIIPVSLVLEPDNPFHPHGHAISVRCEDRVLGYLSESRSDVYWAELARIVSTGLRPTTKARLMINSDLYGPTPQFSVAVALGQPGTVVPVNDPPIANWALLPWGNALPVIKESEHYPALKQYVPETGEAQLLVSLHHEQDYITGAAFVEVRLDGQRVGELPAAASGQFLPAIDHFSAQGVVAVARAFIQGSSVAAKLTLYVARACDISNDELNYPRLDPLARLVSPDEALFVPDAWQPKDSPAFQHIPAQTQQLPQQPRNFADNQPHYGQQPLMQPPTGQPQTPMNFAPPKSPQHMPGPHTPGTLLPNESGPQQVVYNINHLNTGTQFNNHNSGQQTGNNLGMQFAGPQYQPMIAPQKDMVTAYVLWLFLGLLGVHRFYLRDNVGGLVQLFTMGGFGLWWLADVALIPGLVNRRNQGF